MLRETAERFADDIHEVVDRWKAKPADDQITLAELVGVLETIKFDLIRDAQDRAWGRASAA